MSESSLAAKLLVRPGQSIAVINPPPGYSGKLPRSERMSTPNTNVDLILLFVNNQSELNRLAPPAMRALKHDGLLWIAYPKKSSKVKTDLTRDVGWSVVDKAGYVGVALVSIDEVWSAMRFRPRECVGKARKQ
jgi:hypothetical protein